MQTNSHKLESSEGTMGLIYELDSESPLVACCQISAIWWGIQTCDLWALFFCSLWTTWHPSCRPIFSSRPIEGYSGPWLLPLQRHKTWAQKSASFPATVTLVLFVSVSPLSFCNSAWWWFIAGWVSWLNHRAERQIAWPRPPPLHGCRMATSTILSVCCLSCLPVFHTSSLVVFCAPPASLCLFSFHCAPREHSESETVPMNLINLHGYNITELGFYIIYCYVAQRNRNSNDVELFVWIGLAHRSAAKVYITFTHFPGSGNFKPFFKGLKPS